MADNNDENTVSISNGENVTNSTPPTETNGQVEGAPSNVVNQTEAQQPPRPGGWAIFKSLLFRMFIMYMIASFFRRSPTPPEQPDVINSEGKAVRPLGPATNIFTKGLLFDLYVYISEKEHFIDFNNNKALFWLEEELEYGDWTSGLQKDGSYFKNGKIETTESMQNNGSIWMHVYIVKAGNSPDPSDTNYDKKFTIKNSKRLNKYKKRKFVKTVNLLTGKSDAPADLIRNDSAFEILSHWHPNLTLNMIEDYTPWSRGSVPAPLNEYIEFLPTENNYHPILYVNDYWNMNKEYMPINNTVDELTFRIDYAPMSLFKWQMYAAQTMRNKWYSFMPENDDDDEQDSVKQTLMETNPYLLGLTVIVSIVHSIFEFLAFKNDIQFWRNRKSLEGLSVRSVFFNVFQSLIVCLYVLDHETNFVVKCSVFIGLLIEVWKIGKVVNVKFDMENKIFGLIPKLRFEDKSTYTESSTKKYDMLAFKYLSWALFPLLGCYAVYSVMYQEHKGWYSWVLSMLYGFLLTFGFIMMTPQLFINYKLKSVAHLPWRTFTYKALNTFIDDIFAFVIKMPTLYRLGCFRDDIVFLIFLYQRYIYKIDPKRVNEFGTSQEMLEENKNDDIKPLSIDENTTAEKSGEEKKND